MFAQRLAGRSVASIARDLTERGVPCPSDADPDRNRHRDGKAWTLRTVAVILGNPRYTGRQVWDRQGIERGAGRTSRRSSPGEWAVSATPAHPALVSEAEFVAAQQVRAARSTRDGRARRYLLAGLMRCAVCGRRMDAHWVHGRTGYRCRHGYSSSRPRPPDAYKNVYVREAAVHDLRLLLSHAAGVGERLDARTTRAAMLIRLNQLAAAGSGIHPGSWRRSGRHCGPARCPRCRCAARSGPVTYPRWPRSPRR
jgi:hypothetical protein